MEHTGRPAENAGSVNLIYAAEGCDREAAQILAEHLGAPLTSDPETAAVAAQDGLILISDVAGLSLSSKGQTMRADLTTMMPRLKQSNLQGEFLVKAVRIKGVDPREMMVLDATAGMGEDSLLLAAAGFRVHLYECDPVIAALLRDALRRAAEHPVLAEIVGRMELTEGDSIAALHEIAGSDSNAALHEIAGNDSIAAPGELSAECDRKTDRRTPDVILLDPMFPERQKSALVKKKFQLIHQLERPCSAEEELLSAAIGAHPRKVVIKRPLKGPFLAGKKPSYSLSGKAIRYDCILVP